MNNSVKMLYIIRGIPGAGKTTTAKRLIDTAKNIVPKCIHYEADMFFTQSDGTYKWNPRKIGAAHNKCFNVIEKAMENDTNICIVSNTFTTLKELQPYIDLAEDYDYELKVVRVVSKDYYNTELDRVRRFAGHLNQHSVPFKSLERMAARFDDYDGEEIILN